MMLILQFTYKDYAFLSTKLSHITAYCLLSLNI